MRQAEAYRTRKTFRATHFADIIGTRTRRSVDQENLSMTEEQLERKIEFIVDTLAQVAVNDQKHDIRLSRLERIAKLMVRARRSERRTNHVVRASDRGGDGADRGAAGCRAPLERRSRLHWHHLRRIRRRCPPRQQGWESFSVPPRT